VYHRLESDHYVVHFNINLGKPRPQKVVSNVRNYKSVNIESFKHDLKHELTNCNVDLSEDVNDVYNDLEMVLESVLDKHAPSTERTKTIRPVSPWYNDEIHQARQKRKRFERQKTSHSGKSFFVH
jgi:ERCC4-related helicase